MGSDRDGAAPLKVVVITGPIASGKSTLGRAVAVELAVRGVESAVLDLDLVYEMLDPRREPKDDPARWKDARRMAGRIAAGLVGMRPAVVVEGELGTASERADFCDELPDEVEATFVTLAVDFDEAWRRAHADPTRGVSRDRDFLVAHYAAYATLERNDRDLVLDTGRMDVSACARAVADRALSASP